MATTTSSEPERPERAARPDTSAVAGGLHAAHVREVVRALATSPALALPASGDALPRLLADLARGERSSYAATLEAIGAERDVAIEELARRAQFALACLVLPAAGTFYEMLGVAPDAGLREIRRQWGAAMRRYHPDRFGGSNGWLEAQARRLIEAYETLRDPERRRRYDADLRRLPAIGTPSPEPSSRARCARRALRLASRLIAVAGLVILAATTAARLRSGPPPLPPARVPPAPRLLDEWSAAWPVVGRRSRVAAEPPPGTAGEGARR